MGRDSKNFGAGRQLSDCACMILATKSANINGNGSASVDKTISALHDFRDYLAESGKGCLENVDQENYDDYARALSVQVKDNEISPSTAAGRITALNRVFGLDPKGRGIHINAKEYGISRGDRISRWHKAIDDKEAEQIRDTLVAKYGETKDIRLLALGTAISLQRAGGLRLEESYKINLAKKDFSAGRVIIEERGDGAKNARKRSFVPVRGGIEAFKQAQAFQRAASKIFDRGSLIPGDMKEDKFRNFCNNTIREIGGKLGTPTGFHGNRHYYAHRSYEAKWEARTGKSVLCPLAANCSKKGEWKKYASKVTGMTKEECWRIDREIRQELTEELGHGRVDVTNSYLGSSV
jgi:hypothetical protein